MTVPTLRPLIILGCNRSGTTLLFNTLAAHHGVWALPHESQQEFYRYYPMHPEQGDRLTAPPTAAAAAGIHAGFRARMANRTRLPWLPPQLMRPALSRLFLPPEVPLVEKTPANTLRVPFLRKLFPGARFLFLLRRGEAVVSSLMEGWTNWTARSPWSYSRWHYLAPPGWQAYRHSALEEICAFQYVAATDIARRDLGNAPDWMLVRYEDLLADPTWEYRRILAFAEWPESPTLDRAIARPRVDTNRGSAPREGKWRDLHGPAIARVQRQWAHIHAWAYPTP